MDLLSKAVPVTTLNFVVSSMLAMGAGLTVAQIIEPLRNARLVVLTLLANFVLTPVPTGNQIRTYWWCNPPRVGLA